jgi:5'-nucleotidase (lipoprotein e(P4) family)
MKAKKYLLTGGLVLSSIVSTYFVTVSTVAQQGAAPTPQTADNAYQIGAVIYMQKAAEYRALCYQAFNWARETLEADRRTSKKLPKAERRKPRAVVVDIDETVLDNSPAQSFQIVNRRPFNQKDWTDWVEMRKAKAIPGAVDFAVYAKSRDVRIFYVSNRDEIHRAATVANLKAVGFPDVSDENVLLRQSESGKEARRQAIAARYRIVTLLGDNLNDLASVYERKSIADRFLEVDRAKALYGHKFIVLPNAMYGEWESAVYEYQRLTEAQKAEKRAAALELP